MFPEKSTEFQFIDRIRQQVRLGNDVRIGIGDDAAVVGWPAATDAVVAADMLLEGVHFDLETATPEDAGRKALAVNLSDLAAMAAIPRFAVVSLCVPARSDSPVADGIMRGLIRLAEQFGVSVIGGDTNAWDGPMIINVTVIGESPPDGPVTRSGARPGDVLFVTGSLGGSLAGHHLSFQPRVHEARQLRELVSLNAMIDISDGLVADLYHLCEESEVGARIVASAIPVRPVVGDSDDRSPLQRALGDGEDFELLFAVSPQDAAILEQQTSVSVVRIGEVTSDLRCELETSDGIQSVPRLGWRHDFDEPPAD